MYNKEMRGDIASHDLVEFFIRATYHILDAKKGKDGHYEIKFNEGLVEKEAEDFLIAVRD